MSAGPLNATLSGDGFRFYRWVDAVSAEEYDLLSVTSIRRLCGESFTLVNWQLANIIDSVMGTVKRPAMGKRGKPLKSVTQNVVDEYPSEFVKRYMAADGKQGPLDELRKWVRETADEPRNIAAMRGTMVHEAIEKNVAFDRVERPYVEAAFSNMSSRDKARAKRGVSDADVLFIRDGVRQYWDMRQNVPFVIITREPQVFNLTLGYGGSADVLIWFLGHFEDDVFVPLPNLDAMSANLPKGRNLTLEAVERIGGTLAVGDWKTSKGVYTDQVVQVHAYGAGEFVGSDGVRDHRLTDILQATTMGVLFHIRPTGWAVHVFPFTEEVFNGFVGSVAFARLLAKYPHPTSLFTTNYKGGLPAETQEDPE